MLIKRRTLLAAAAASTFAAPAIAQSKQIQVAGATYDMREAILGGCWVELDLQTAGFGRMSWRNRVGPIAFLLGEGRQYLVGFSDYRQQVQLFRLARLRGVRVLSEAYERPEGFDLSRWLARSFGTWRDEPHQIEWRFASHVAAEVR